MATILREKEKVGDKSYMLRLKYTASDAKVALQDYVRKHPTMIKSPMVKKDVLALFFETILNYLPKRNARPLADWLFGQAMRNGYIVAVPKIWMDDEQEYIVAPDITSKRPGPKRKQETT